MKTQLILISVILGVAHLSLVADSRKLSPKLSAIFNICPPDFTGNLPNPEDCHSFYICHVGNPSLTPCPERLCFNPSNDQCDHCSEVPGCESGTGRPPTGAPPSSTTTAATQPPPSSTTTERQPSSQPPPSTPGNEPTTAPTPPTDETTTSRNTTPPPEGDLPCPGLPFIYMPYPGDCNKFYYCVDGVNTGIYNCSPGLWFNFQMQACVPPWGDSCA